MTKQRELRLTRLRLRNFMRFGDRWTTIDLSKDGLVLVLGRNGHGKSTVLDAISFAMTGKAVRKAIPGKLVNRVNKKDMLVSLDLEVGELEVRIVRGMKPGLCKLYVRQLAGATGDIERPEHDRTLDSIQRTSAKIESVVKMDHELLTCMMINSTRRPTFFQAESSVQKSTVETLFGYRAMTDKAEAIKARREALDSELATKRAFLLGKKASRDAMLAQLAALEAKKKSWIEGWTERMAKANTGAWAEITADHDAVKAQIAAADGKRAEIASHESLLAAAKKAGGGIEAARSAAQVTRGELARANAIAAQAAAVDFDAEIAMHGDIADLEAELAGIKSAEAVARSEHDAALRAATIARKAHDGAEGLECPVCNREWPDAIARAKHADELAAASAAADTEWRAAAARLADVSEAVGAMAKEIAEFRSIPKTKSAADAEKLRGAASAAGSRVDKLEEDLAEAERLVREIEEADDAAAAGLWKLREELAALPRPRLQTLVDVEREAQQKIAADEKLALLSAETCPHTELAASLAAEIPTEADTTEVDALAKLSQHCSFLERVLTRKDSPVRRAVTSMYLPPLNAQLNKYLSKLGLPYTVEFTDELEPMIMDGEDDVDPGAISGGEEERLAMSLSWAFRDAYEEINGTRLCFAAIDERLDSGLDFGGAELAIAQLRETSLQAGRSVWLVTHRREFLDHADHVLVVDRGDGRYSDVSWQDKV